MAKNRKQYRQNSWWRSTIVVAAAVLGVWLMTIQYASVSSQSEPADPVRESRRATVIAALTRTPTPTPTPVQLRITSVSPDLLAPGDTARIEGGGPAGGQVTVFGAGLQLGTVIIGDDNRWLIEVPFNLPGSYRLTSRVELPTGGGQAGLGDLTITVAFPSPTRTPMPTDTPVPPTPTPTPRLITPTRQQDSPPAAASSTPVPPAPPQADLSFLDRLSVSSPLYPQPTDLAEQEGKLTWKPMSLGASDTYLVAIKHSEGTDWAITNTTTISIPVWMTGEIKWAIVVCRNASLGGHPRYSETGCTPLSPVSEIRTYSISDQSAPGKSNNGGGTAPPVATSEQ